MNMDEQKRENKRKKEFLQKYKKAKLYVERLEEKRDELRFSKISPSVNQDGMPHAHNASDLSGYIVKIDDIEKKIIKARYKAIVTMQEVCARIEQIEDEREKNVLFFKYIKDYTWEEIAVKMKYGYRNVQKIHGKALKSLKI